MFSSPADVLLDPMMGTGGVLKVAKALNRKSIGIDVDSDCVEIAKGRLR
jgi:DNA modification methylase